MSPEEYLDGIKTYLTENDTIIRYTITREQFTPINAHIRARLQFIDNSRLEFSEFIRINDQTTINIVSYSYHWMDANDNLIARWDNTEHYPNLPGFPHHLHDGDDKNVLPGEPMTLFKVLDFIAKRLKQ